MKCVRLLGYALPAAAVLLSACASLCSTPVAPASSNALIAVSGSTVMTRADHRRSWMSPGAKHGNLLYVSDAGTFDVRVYRYPSLAPAGTLTGFDRPEGLCSDGRGNVWVTNTLSYDILEFAHGGTSPVATLVDPVGYPAGCAVDSSSGNLAVTNLYDFSGTGSVIVYHNAGGTPTPYANSAFYEYYFDGYDGKGNLYVDGRTISGAYVIAVLARGSSSLSLVSVTGGTIYFPGTVATHGSTLVLGDQQCKNSATSCLYATSVSGKTARITATIPLATACDVAQAWVGPSAVAGGDYEYCGSGKSGVDIWRYPAGGKPVASKSGLQMPVGATLSR
ncbi:MAG TPA: hypothetical protein VFF63_02080 [Candidatus Babeliales bacterium]|nr:hypothetical protein [Candidatus Babeliales bacterium]